VVPHRDVDAVAQALDDRDEERALVVTDGVFSVDGDAAPVAAMHAVVRAHGGLLLVDEAHAFGVVGDRGEGVVAAASLGGETDVVRTLTLSKALGSQGGAVVGAVDVIAHLVDTARTFIFDTGLAPGSAGAALESLRILRAEPDLPDRVRGNAGDLAALAGVPALGAAVVAIPMGEPDVAVAAAHECRQRGVLVGCFRPPSVPDGVSRLRLTARADLSAGDLERAAAALQAIRR
jgi:8-amino-7-oxononanoate synthase